MIALEWRYNTQNLRRGFLRPLDFSCYITVIEEFNMIGDPNKQVCDCGGLGMTVEKDRLQASCASNVPSDDALRQMGIPTREEREEMISRQRAACGYMTASELAKAQREALILSMCAHG